MASVCDKDKAEPVVAMSGGDDLLQAQTELYHHSLAFVKSMALRAAAGLRIPDAIHRLGGAATLPEHSWILHCWQDEDCIKILQKCKEAIPTRDAGGKVIIIDMVVGLAAAGSPETVSSETQVFSDVYKMYMDGVEREEHEWKKIFLEAGFSDYKISPVLGFRSTIEVYP